MNRNKYLGINGLRTYAAIGIVILHILTNLSNNFNGVVFELIIPSFTDLVFLFMIISSFSMCCGYYEKIKNNRIQIDEFYLKRFKKIMPFFCFVSFLDLIINISTKSIAEFFANSTLVFGLLPNIGFDVIGVGWYLGVVFLFYMLFPFYCFSIWNKKRAWITFTISIVYYIFGSKVYGIGRTNILYCSMFFVVGGLIYLYNEKITEYLSKKNNKYMLICLACLMYLLYLKLHNIIFLLPLFSILIALSINTESKFMSNKFTSVISYYSLEIYLSHMIIFRLIIKIFNIYEMTNLIVYIILVITTLIGAILFSKFFTYFNKLFMEVVKNVRKKIKWNSNRNL